MIHRMTRVSSADSQVSRVCDRYIVKIKFHDSNIVGLQKRRSLAGHSPTPSLPAECVDIKTEESKDETL